MSAHASVRMDVSPISIVAASARTAHGAPHSAQQDALDEVARDGFDPARASEKARVLPRKAWLIVAAGLVAWALVAVPVWLIFG